MIIRIGTRKSALAIIQTEMVINAIKKQSEGIKCEIVPMTTVGDQIRSKPLVAFGGKGAFVTEFETALLTGKIDLAVHSAKDMPMEVAPGLEIMGTLPRADARDVLVTRKGERENLHIVGSSSLRRKLQMEQQYAVTCKEIRGNVDTRLHKLEEGEYDGIVLAAAGLERLGIKEGQKYEFTYLDTETFIPAGGQAIIAVEGRSGDSIRQEIRKWSHEETMRCLMTERKVLQLLHAGCHDPIGVYAKITEEKMRILLMWHGEKVYEIEGRQVDYLELARKIVEMVEG